MASINDDVNPDIVTSSVPTEVSQTVLSEEGPKEKLPSMEEAPIVDATPVVLPDKRKGAKDHFRYEGASNPSSFIPIGHDLTHKPANENCEVCQFVKLKKTPAIQTDPDTSARSRAENPFDMGHADLLQVRKTDYKGRTRVLVTKDERTKYPRAAILDNKTATHVFDEYIRLYPGNRFEQKDKRFFKEVSCDRGKEFEETFEKGVVHRGGKIRRAIPGRSKNNSIAELAVKDFQIGAATALAHAGGPDNMWSLAGLHWVYNAARSIPIEDGKTSFELEKGSKFVGTLVPWGCAAVYLDMSHDKCDPRGLPGIIVGYELNGAMQVLDVVDYSSCRKVRIVISRDFHADRNIFPFKSILSKEERSEDASSLLVHVVEEEPPETYEDFWGETRCRIWSRCSCRSTK
jgi:hypothetical protein